MIRACLCSHEFFQLETLHRKIEEQHLGQVGILQVSLHVHVPLPLSLRIIWLS